MSDCDSVTWTGVLVVTDVLCVLLPSAVAEICEGVSSGSDWESVEPQSFSFSKKRSIVCVEHQEDMSCAGTPAKAPPTSRRRMMPPTPQQSSSRPCSGELKWRTREAAGMLVKELLLRK